MITIEQGTTKIRSISRSLQILKAFIDEPEMTLSRIANKVSLSKTTTFRIISTLENEGFLYRKNQSVYCLGMILMRLGTVVKGQLDLIEISMPIMKALNQKVNETISLNIVIENKRQCISKVDSTHAVRDFIEMNKLLIMHRGASGKVLLAFLEKSKQRCILESIIEENFDLGVLKTQLFEIREKGYAISFGDRIVGATAIAAPIFDRKSRLVASLGLSGASIRFTDEQIPEYIKLVMENAMKISEILGHNRYTSI